MHVRTVVPVSARRAWRGLAQPRSTPRRPARVAADDPAWIARRIPRARRFGRSGSRRITALRRAEGWRVNHKRVERLWRQEGLPVPRKAPRRRRLWATDGSCTRRRAERPNHASGPTPSSTSGRRTAGPGACGPSCTHPRWLATGGAARLRSGRRRRRRTRHGGGAPPVAASARRPPARDGPAGVVSPAPGAPRGARVVPPACD